MTKKIIALRSPEESEDGWFYMYFEVPKDYELDVEHFEKDFRKVYNNDDLGWDWRMSFDDTAEKYGLEKEVGIQVTDLSI